MNETTNTAWITDKLAEHDDMAQQAHEDMLNDRLAATDGATERGQ